MKTKALSIVTAAACCALLTLSCASKPEAVKKELTTVGNPYLPLWEHIPDGEPYVFEDPDQPGKQRVYIYGSHDSRITDYCGRELVVWSASVDSLNHWRYDGEILKVDKNAKGELLDSAGLADVLFAPDVTLVTDSTGKKTYYLYPNDQAGGRNGLIAKSDRPDGPFEVCNWSKTNPNEADGVLRFDPAVFVDDDGRVYGYWGFGHSMGAELDPETMATVKPGTKAIDGMIPGYQEKLDTVKEASGEEEAVICGTAKIHDRRVCVFAMEAHFMMGSMGSVVGEKITSLFEYAAAHRLPVIGYVVSGGARMQEGLLSLMQMAKTSAAVKRHNDAGLLYVAILTDPTTGGVTASFGMEADIILAEPGATIGFAGARVVEQTTRKALPKGFQTAEFVQEHGFVDNIIARNRQRSYLSAVLKAHGGR